MKFIASDQSTKVNINKIFSGYGHCFAFSTSGDIFAWGNCASSRLTKDYGDTQLNQPKLINFNFKANDKKFVEIDEEEEENDVEKPEEEEKKEVKEEIKENVDDRKIIAMINEDGSIRTFNELMVKIMNILTFNDY